MNAATRTALWLSGSAIAACSRASPTPTATVQAPEPSAAASAAPERRSPALDPREQEIFEQLERDVARLAVEIGERNVQNSLNLASATDLIATELESLGYEVRRQGYQAGDEVVQNLEVGRPGGLRGRQLVVVGAHFDTHAGSPGADDNASGVAGLLALCRALRNEDFSRSVRFVFFATEEQPYFQTDEMGSLVYAKSLADEGREVVAMLSLESIGYYSKQPGSQRYPEGLSSRYPTTGDFIAVVGNEASRILVERVEKTLAARLEMAVVGDALPERVDGVGWSDHWAFWRMGYRAVMITDTAPFRYPHYHRATDLPEHLDFATMAKVVVALEHVVRELAGKRRFAAPTADAGPPG